MARDRDDSDRKRHRSHSHKSSKHHHKDRERKSSRRDDEKHSHDDRKSSKLTEEEKRLYEKAKAFVEQQDRHDDKRSDSDGHERRRHKSHSHKSGRKEHKRSKRDEHHSHKKSKKDRHNRDERKHKHDKSTTAQAADLYPLGPITSNPPSEPLSLDLHYFSHNPHLRLYLYRTHHLHFEDLSSSQARKYFVEFCKAYNSGQLEEAYYQPNLPEGALDQCSRTKHTWKFKVNEIEEEKLDLVKRGVKKQTEYDTKGASDSAPALKPAVASRNDNMDDYEKEQLRDRQRAEQRLSDKRHRERIKVANEEMDPHGKPSTGWERSQEKKREISHAMHGAHRDREDAISGDLDDNALYNSGDGGYAEAAAKMRGRREKREAEMEARVQEGKRKEEEKRKEMLAMLGLSGVDAGKKITIAPRRDG